MDNRLMAEGIIRGIKSFGAEVVKVTDDKIYLTIPRHPISEKEVTPEQIARKTQEIFDYMAGERKITIKYKVVD